MTCFYPAIAKCFSCLMELISHNVEPFHDKQGKFTEVISSVGGPKAQPWKFRGGLFDVDQRLAVSSY